MKSLDSGAHLAALMQLDKTTLPSDGGMHFNRLIFSRSPYLLQHAENPVDWYEWCDEAFERARNEQKIVLLSIGYATCHWCHVMAHECFEDSDVAELLNQHFICIKVDREERPDIDDFYMTVSQVLTGSGGWPLNVFMTPDKHPFFTMTYLPKRGRGGSGGFMELLAKVAAFWQQRPEDILENCRGIMDALDHLKGTPSGECIDLESISLLAMEHLSASYDQQYGGFGTAPKFPMPINLSWLIQQDTNGTPKALEMALHSLQMMRQGGIWDHLAGGLHRYSVDREWLVPHFEKMLYDQAMISRIALEAFQSCGDELYLEMAQNIFWFVENELTAPGGAFYSALDADSEGKEGTFYLWDKQEIDELLGKDSDLFCRVYDVTDRGNFEERTILNMPKGLADFCQQEGYDQEETEVLLEECRQRLLEYREQRIRPLRDEKIITAWNGLMIAALAKGGAISGYPRYTELATDAARFILQHLRRADGRLLRSYLHDTPTTTPAFLEDYAALCLGLLELYEATLEQEWLDQALWAADEIIRLFKTPTDGLFRKSGSDAEQMPGRATLEHDGVTPSPYSCAALCFARLGHTCDREDLLDYGHTLLTAALDDARRNPTGHLGTLQAQTLLESEPVRITFHGKPHHPDMADYLQLVKFAPLFNVVIHHENSTSADPSITVCANGTCYPPATSIEALEALLSQLLPINHTEDDQ